MPLVHRLWEEFKARGLQVVLVDIREPAALVGKVVQERGYTAPVLLDASGETAGVAYGVFGPPTIYLIDRQGRLLARAAGPVDWSSPAARELITALLGPAGPSPARRN